MEYTNIFGFEVGRKIVKQKSMDPEDNLFFQLTFFCIFGKR